MAPDQLEHELPFKSENLILSIVSIQCSLHISYIRFYLLHRKKALLSIIRLYILRLKISETLFIQEVTNLFKRLLDLFKRLLPLFNYLTIDLTQLFLVYNIQCRYRGYPQWTSLEYLEHP
uniref:Uncharacterized protein n=1 Tax=Cacopsylla melanoneura TaxID=428564 RepID=A0A8D9E9K4_9HEMI